MKKTRLLSVLTAVLLTAVLALSALPAFAEGTTYTPVSGSSVKTVMKYLVMDKNANVPNVTFSYSIAPGAAQAASGTNSAVFAGNDASKVTGTPSIGSATFAPNDTTYTEAQTIASSDLNTKVATGTKDAVVLAEGEKYARKTITTDFSGVSFKEPGIYRYIITETGSSPNQGITNDDDLERILDVYVIDNNGTLEIQGYVLHNTEDDDTVAVDGTSAAGKSAGYVNRYTTHDLTLSKTVTGNQGSKDEYFEFTVVISNAVAGTVYDVDIRNADAVTKTNAINTTAHNNPEQIVTSGESTEVKFWLQNGQSVVIKGLADGTSYTITENDTTLDNEGYTTTVAQTGDTDGTFTADTRKLENAGISADTTDAFTNNKSGVIPTGVIFATGAGAAAAAAGIALYGIIAHKRKEDEGYDA